MPRKSVKSGSSTRMNQRTLDAFIGSSSPPRPSESLQIEPSSRFHGKKKSRVRRSKPIQAEQSHERLTDEEGSQSSDVGDIHFEPQAPDVAGDNEDESPRRPKTQRLRRRMRSVTSDDENNVASQATSEDEAESPVTWRGNVRKGKRKQTLILGDSDEEEQPLRKRKLVKGVRPASPEENEVDLLDEVDEDKIVESRLRTRGKRSEYQKSLEKLKRRKQGRRQLSPSSEEEELEPDFMPFDHAKPDRSSNVSQSFDGETDDAEQDLDAFIVEDDDNVAPELPPEFSMNTYQDLNHHFKIICQLLVHLAVQEASNRRPAMEQLLRNTYFSVPLQITRRKIMGMRDSLVTSSVWRPELKNSLETYPILETVRMEFAVPMCDACHLGGRMSTILGRLSGKPYDKVSFEPLSEHDDSDSSDDEHPEPLKKEFHLGRFCAARTRVFHKFTHWEYALFTSLLEEVDLLRNDDSHGFVRVAFAGGRKPPDDLSDADAIMDWLDEREIINIEWKRVNDMMEEARNLEMKARKGDDDID
ncbi:uncharacterized protein LAESUDRAFT_694923 [Laetiporus sulphureus 93-53]|uniref:DUF4211 domain-containing protein n=1 Tax=Laetiporus sulphureus 93-53 TaxID=1314785 RepID=A0A165FUS2_9APHY|nr:uncharacterized protein LAESUDRAFT_694923 [Laetiporus sulphureus 93-53]KZT09438.1 hypothetical protein LAESUDRAFT_694923 [Laetiporus sulphureus 93-53]